VGVCGREGRRKKIEEFSDKRRRKAKKYAKGGDIQLVVISSGGRGIGGADFEKRINLAVPQRDVFRTANEKKGERGPNRQPA